LWCSGLKSVEETVVIRENHTPWREQNKFLLSKILLMLKNNIVIENVPVLTR
jgi:hypothetical protein